MKIKSLLTCMMVSLVTILPLQAQVGKEMKAFRNKDGITVTMLNPSLYSLYKQGDLSLPAEEALKDMKEINVMQVDIKRATPKVVEEISQRITPIVENEAKYTLVRSHRGAYSQEYLYVTQHEERITQHADRSGCIRFRFYQKTGRTLWHKKRFHFRKRPFWFIPGKFR